jgi:hypothetical protein
MAILLFILDCKYVTLSETAIFMLTSVLYSFFHSEKFSCKMLAVIKTLQFVIYGSIPHSRHSLKTHLA